MVHFIPSETDCNWFFLLFTGRYYIALKNRKGACFSYERHAPLRICVLFCCEQTAYFPKVGNQVRGSLSRAVKRSRQIAITGIRKKNHNVLALVLRTLCKLKACPHCGTRADTREEPFCLGKLLAGLKGCLIRHLDDFIIDGGVQSLRDKACTDSLNLVRACIAAGKHRRGFRLHRDDLHLRILLLQVFADTA